MSGEDEVGTAERVRLFLGLLLVLAVLFPAAASSVRGLFPEPSVPGTIGLRTIQLNAAGAAELETLPGIGPALAARIVADREKHGPFASPADLDRVPGIGPATLHLVTPYVQ